MVAAKDPGKKHFYISVAKSVLRLIGCTLLFSSGIPVVIGFGVLFFAAEILGIVEEL